VIAAPVGDAKPQGPAVPPDAPAAPPPEDSDAQAMKKRLGELQAAQQLWQQQQEMMRAQIAEHLQASPEQRIAQLHHLPESARAWLLEHQDYYTDPAKNVRLGQLHAKAMDMGGHEAFSPGYFEYIERAEGLRPQQPQTAPPAMEERPVQYSPPPRPNGAAPRYATTSADAKTAKERDTRLLEEFAAEQRGPIVSAPPTREIPGSSGRRFSNSRVTLTPEQLAHAKVAGVSSEDYARGLIKLEQRRQAGLLQD
jgi:hypothetical protein